MSYAVFGNTLVKTDGSESWYKHDKHWQELLDGQKMIEQYYPGQIESNNRELQRLQAQKNELESYRRIWEACKANYQVLKGQNENLSAQIAEQQALKRALTDAHAQSNSLLEAKTQRVAAQNAMLATQSSDLSRLSSQQESSQEALLAITLQNEQQAASMQALEEEMQLLKSQRSQMKKEHRQQLLETTARHKEEAYQSLQEAYRLLCETYASDSCSQISLESDDELPF